MFDRLKAATKAFATSIKGPIGEAAKAFYGGRGNAINYPSTAVGAGNGKTDVTGIINNLPLSRLRDYASYLWAGSSKVWCAWKCCDLVAKVVAGTPHQLMRMSADGKKGTEAQNPEIEELLKKANPFETFDELLARAVFHLKLTGSCFIAKDQTDIEGNRPRALYLLNPRRIILALDRNSQIGGFLYVVGNGRTIPFDVSEVIHIKLPHPDRDYWGLGEVEAGENLYQDFINRQTWLEKFWQNGASPSGILYAKDSQVTDKEQWEQAKKEWQKQYGGAENSGKTAWLTGDWGYLQMGLTAHEMQTIENATWSVEQICILAGVPLSVIGVKEAANYATAQVDEVRFRKYTCKPMVDLIASKLNDGLIHGWDETLFLKFAVEGLIDIELSSRAIPLIVGAGVMSPNDARDLLGLERVDDPLMDQYYLSNTLVPMALAGMASSDGSIDGQSQDVVKRFIMKMFNRHDIDDHYDLPGNPPQPRRISDPQPARRPRIQDGTFKAQ